jgi:dynein intermediate chain, cytosolic
MADEARSQRQAAIADKKKRLEELKARRTNRSSVATAVVGDGGKSKTPTSANLDEYIDGLLKVPTAPVVSTTTNEPSSARPPPGEQASETTKADGGAATSMPNNVVAEPAPAVSFAPAKHVESYEAGTQTEDDDFPPTEDDDEDQYQPEPVEGNEDPNVTEPSYRNYAEEDLPQEEVKVLTAEEMEIEVASAPFASFLNAASKKVERVLGSGVLADLLVDYSGETDGYKRTETRASDGSKYLSSRQMYEYPRWTATRDVTDMDWSPLHRELMLSSYHMQSSTSSMGQPLGSSAVSAIGPDDTPSASLAPRSGELQSDGLVLVWSLAMPSRPEHIFTCGSPVSSARFHPSESPLVIGGCQSGQVVVWDVRAGRMPVQKSSLTTSATGGKGHTHPICAMEIVEGGVSILLMFSSPSFRPK